MIRLNRRKIFTTFVVSAISIVSVSFVVRSVYALSEDRLDFFAENDIMFYDPDEGKEESEEGKNNEDENEGENNSNNGEACAVIRTNTTGMSAKQKVWSSLKSQDISDVVAAGIMGNMQVMSGFSPVRYDDAYKSEWVTFNWEKSAASGHGIGLIQWSGKRRVNFFEYMRKYSEDLTKRYLKNPMTWGAMNGDAFIMANSNRADVDALYKLEVAYLVKEMKGSDYFAKVFKEKTVEGATSRFAINVADCHECVNTDSQNLKTRIQYAQAIYDEFHGRTEFDGGSASDLPIDFSWLTNGDNKGPSCTVPVSEKSKLVKKLQDLVVKWAWSTFWDYESESDRKSEGREYMIQSKDAYRDLWIGSDAENQDMRKASNNYYGSKCYDQCRDTLGDARYNHCKGVDCGAFVNAVMHVSGWDEDYESGGVKKQMNYLGKQAELDNGAWSDVTDSIKSNDDLEPGDVVICSNKSDYKRPGCTQGHVILFVGEIDGFNSLMASASMCDYSKEHEVQGRGPSADRNDPMHVINDLNYSVYRRNFKEGE